MRSQQRITVFVSVVEHHTRQEVHRVDDDHAESGDPQCSEAWMSMDSRLKDLSSRKSGQWLTNLIRFLFKHSLPNLTDRLHAEVFLDGCLIAAKHGGPVNGSTDHHAPEAVPNGRVGIHVEELHSSRAPICFPYRGYTTLPTEAVANDEEQRAEQHRCLESVRHYDCLHSTLQRNRKGRLKFDERK